MHGNKPEQIDQINEHDTMEAVIKLEKIVKNYKGGTQIVMALRSVSLQIKKV